MRLVRLILILAKEFLIGRHLWKWSIVIPLNGSSYPFKKLLSSVPKVGRSNPFQNNRQLFELLVAIRWKKHKTLFVQKISAVRASASRFKKILSLLLWYYAEVCFWVQQTLRSSLSHVRWHRVIIVRTDIKWKKPHYHLRALRKGFVDWCHWNQWNQWKRRQPIGAPIVNCIYLLPIFNLPSTWSKKKNEQ